MAVGRSQAYELQWGLSAAKVSVLAFPKPAPWQVGSADYIGSVWQPNEEEPF